MTAYSNTDAQTHVEPATAHLTIKSTIHFAVRLVFRDAAQLWPRLVLPMLAGGLALWGALYLYLLEYERYLVLPSDRAASLVLGVATAGLLVTLFSHSVTTAAIASLALGRPDRGWKYFCASRRAWRTYAAYLRFFLAAAVVVAVAVVLQGALGRIWSSPLFATGASFGLVAALAVLVVRGGFLIAPVAAAHDKGEVVRQSWRLSSRHFWKLAAIMFFIALPGFGIEFVCETAIRFSGLTAPMEQGGYLADFVAAYRHSLPAILFAVGTAYALSVVLLVAASAAAYRQITGHEERPEET